MNKRYRLGEIEEAVAEMEELIDIEDDIAEIDDDFQIVVSGWSVYVESLNLTLRQGIACVWDAEEGLFMPDFDVTIVYEGNIETGYSRSDASVVNESGESMQALNIQSQVIGCMTIHPWKGCNKFYCLKNWNFRLRRLKR